MEPKYTLEECLRLLKAQGYRVSKPKVMTMERPALNSLGKPMSASYDPNYKRRMPLTSISRLFGLMPNCPWVKGPEDRATCK